MRIEAAKEKVLHMPLTPTILASLRDITLIKNQEQIRAILAQNIQLLDKHRVSRYTNLNT